MTIDYTANDKIAEARASGQWLRWAGDTSIVFSPNELAEEQARGRFRHGNSNFYLIEPARLLSNLDERIAELQEKRRLLVERIERETGR